MKKVTILMRKAPYGSVYSAEGYRAIMALGVFEMEVRVVFLDDGVYVLLKGQDPSQLEMKPLGDGFPMLSEFDVDQFYVHAPSLAERGLSADDLVIGAELLDDAGISDIIQEGDAVLPF
jgi:tRNA 2-thiouridine synthesizing protein C